MKADALSRLFDTEERPMDQTPKFPASCLVAPVMWELDADIEQALRTEPAPLQCPAVCLYVPSAVRDRLIYWTHKSPSSGHPGIGRTVRCLSGKYWWPTFCTVLAVNAIFAVIFWVVWFVELWNKCFLFGIHFKVTNLSPSVIPIPWNYPTVKALSILCHLPLLIQLVTPNLIFKAIMWEKVVLIRGIYKEPAKHLPPPPHNCRWQELSKRGLMNHSNWLSFAGCRLH